MTGLTTRDTLARALAEHGAVDATCGHRIYGPCSDCLADRLIAAGAVVDVATLVDDEALAERLASDDVHRHYRAVSWGSLSLDSQARYMADMRATLRDLAAALAEATS